MDKSFFLDVFNQILKYGEKEIKIIFDSNGDIWFGLRDTLKVLDYKNYNLSQYMFFFCYKTLL